MPSGLQDRGRQSATRFREPGTNSRRSGLPPQTAREPLDSCREDGVAIPELVMTSGRTTAARSPKLTVAVTGPTGDIGRSLLRSLEASREVGRIRAMARR